jgi:hypothetical protein
LTTQTDISRAYGWSRYFIPFETLMPKGITKYMYDRGYSLCICISDKLNSHALPIVGLQYNFTRLIALKDVSLVEETGIVRKILMMLYISGFKSRFVACKESSSLWLIIYKSPPDFPTPNLIHKINFTWCICLIGIVQSINYLGVRFGRLAGFR